MSFGFDGSCRRTKAEMMPANAVKAKKAGHNRLIIDYPDGRRAFRLHMTDVVTLHPDGSLTLDDGGYPTMTTRRAMGEGVYALVGKWRTDAFNHASVYGAMPRAAHSFNGILFNRKVTIRPDGSADTDYSESEAERMKVLKAKIKKFAARVYKLDAIPIPFGGDCWYCALHTDSGSSGKSLGDATNDTSHLISHIEEGYLHGSLLYNAMRASGLADTGIHLYWQQANNDHSASGRKWAREVMARSLRKYLSKRLGLPA